jgi:type VI secretion system secreted protein VgrG
VRIALPSAGANWGAALVPRIGTEVAVEFIEGDIDRPLIVGQLYNGADRPPFAAGIDSGVNHPGVISGLHTHTLDRAGFNQWVLDDATGQLRMRLLASYTQAELGLGHLISQSAGSAQRGSWRGTGFEAATQGWASVRAAKGLLISTSARAGSYASAQSTQMDAAEALAQLKAAKALGSRLGEAATSGSAQGLASFDAGASVDKLLDAIDPKKDGKHAASVNGQEAQKANGANGSNGRTLGEPVEAFATPLIVLDTPSTAGWASEASIAGFSGQELSVVAQGDVQHTAGHTHASVSGKTTSLYTHRGGAKVIAANGPVSLRAHTDELKILADKDVTVISVNDEIRIAARTRIELIAGQSSVVLEGANITFTTPGAFTAKFSAHAFLGAGGEAAELDKLPDSRVKLFDQQVRAVNQLTGKPIVGLPYKMTTASGDSLFGTTDEEGKTFRATTVGPEAVRIEWGVVSPASTA